MIHEILSIRLQAASDVTLAGFIAFNILSTHGKKIAKNVVVFIYLSDFRRVLDENENIYPHTHTHFLFQ